MKKTIPISIAQTLFYIEEDSYQKLDDYLKEVKKYFSTYADSVDIIQDIESRIREQLLQFSEEDKTERIITEAHIDKLIKNMGWPKEFGESGNEKKGNSESIPKEKIQKRLYRDKDNAIIGGVAAGLAAYFGIDAFIVRSIFFLSIFFGGVGLMIYIFLWFILPTAETATQKLEMHGDRVTLDEVKKIVEEKIGEIGDKEKIKSGTKNFFEKLRNVIIGIGSKLFKIVGKVIGVVLKIASVAGVVSMIAVFGIGVMGVGSAGEAGNIINQFHSLPFFYVLLFLVFLIGLIPFMFLDLLANLLLGKTSFKRRGYAGTMLGVWIVALILGPIIFFSVNDAYVTAVRSNAQITGVEVMETREIKDFTNLHIKDGQHIKIIQGEKTSMEIRGVQDDIDRLIFNETGDDLTIKNSNDWKICIFCRRERMEIAITTPHLSSLSVENDSTVEATLNVEDFKLSIENGSKVTLYGSAKNFKTTLKNASALYAKDFVTSTLDVEMSNASKAEANVTVEIAGAMSNASTLIQYGSGTIDKIEKSNGSKVEKAAG